MKIFIGTDHAGYVLKEKLVSSLRLQGYEVIDEGAFKYDEDDDYPDLLWWWVTRARGNPVWANKYLSTSVLCLVCVSSKRARRNVTRHT